ncbi:MAG: putative membrane protein, partial [uncultured Pseudonocardia sp.]
ARHPRPGHPGRRRRGRPVGHHARRARHRGRRRQHRCAGRRARRRRPALRAGQRRAQAGRQGGRLPVLRADAGPVRAGRERAAVPSRRCAGRRAGPAVHRRRLRCGVRGRDRRGGRRVRAARRHPGPLRPAL